MKIQVTVLVPKEQVEKQKWLVQLGIDQEIIALAFLRVGVGLVVESELIDQALTIEAIHSATEFTDGAIGRFCTMVLELEDNDLAWYLLDYLDGEVVSE